MNTTTITPITAANAPENDPFPIIDISDGEGLYGVWDRADHAWADIDGRDHMTLAQARDLRQQLTADSHQVRSAADDDYAPNAYLGRVRPADNGGWTAERTNWDDTSADHDADSAHLVIDTLTGDDAQDRAAQTIRDLYEDWKDRRNW